MKKLLALALGAILVPAAAFAANYQIDPSHSNILFSVKHNMISNVSGSFNEYSGTFTFDEKKPEVSSANVTIKAASIDTDNEKRDEHLRSDDFFAADKHPEITFVSKSVKKAGKGKFKLTGDLTMRGVTKPVTFDVEHTGSAKDMQGAERVGFTATSSIKRKDFGINWNKALDRGGVVVSDDVKITFQLEGVKQAAGEGAEETKEAMKETNKKEAPKKK